MTMVVDKQSLRLSHEKADPLSGFDLPPCHVGSRLGKILPVPELRLNSHWVQQVLPNLALLRLGDDGPGHDFQFRAEPVPQLGSLMQKIQQPGPFPWRAQAFVALRGAVPITADHQCVQSALLDKGLKIAPVNVLGVGGYFKISNPEPGMLLYGPADPGQVRVQQWFAVVEQTEGSDDVHIQVVQAGDEIVQRHGLDFGVQCGIGAAKATQLAAAHNIQVQLPDEPLAVFDDAHAKSIPKSSLEALNCNE